jgi:hypothetical protein
METRLKDQMSYQRPPVFAGRLPALEFAMFPVTGRTDLRSEQVGGHFPRLTPTMIFEKRTNSN